MITGQTTFTCTDASGNRVVTSTAYGADGSLAFIYKSVTAPDGHWTGNFYDTNGDGVWDQQQSISKWTAADGLSHDYVRNTVDGVIISNTDTARTVAGVMPHVTTILRDSTGGGWWDQKEVRTLAARRPTQQRITRRVPGKPQSADIRLRA